MAGALWRGLLLLAALGAYGWYLRGGPFGAAFLAERRFARLAARSATVFGGGALLVLLGLGQLDGIVRVPAPFARPAQFAVDAMPGLGEPEGMALIAGGMVAGGLIGAAVSRWRRRVFAIGDIRAVLPRSRGELGWAVLLAIESGVGEELFFRLALPLLIALLTGSGWIGFAGATALFGAAHRYQGWKGVAATTLVGGLMVAVYLASGRLWLAMALHTAINLNGLVLRPLASGLWGAGEAR